MSSTLTVNAAGRQIAVESYGDLKGEPLFFFHGWPSSRQQGALADQTAAEMGIRLLAVDRPGCGGSDLHIGRSLRDWPEVLAALADHVEAETFHVLGVSGGGPYALASAWGLPERVKAAAVVSGAPPLAERADVSGLMPVYQHLLRFYRSRPNAMRLLFRAVRPVARIRPPNWLFRMALHTLPDVDRVALAEPSVMDRAWHGYAGSWAGHPDGVFHDARIYAAPWGFDLSEIRVPVRLWHGRKDNNFHWKLAEELATKIPGCQARIVDNEGHYSLIIRHCREIFQNLMAEVPHG
jgi:pimeloyl-ACP methyl ester carboxylesterase